MKRPCIECGTLSENTRCDECKAPDSNVLSASARGYDSRWARLSRRARQLSPLCEDCGTTEDLTADHSPEAWRRHDAGLSIRLEDIAVLCRSCNSKKGRARPQEPSSGPRSTRGALPSPGALPDRRGSRAARYSLGTGLDR